MIKRKVLLRYFCANLFFLLNSLLVSSLLLIVVSRLSIAGLGVIVALVLSVAAVSVGTAVLGSVGGLGLVVARVAGVHRLGLLHGLGSGVGLGVLVLGLSGLSRTTNDSSAADHGVGNSADNLSTHLDLNLLVNDTAGTNSDGTGDTTDEASDQGNHGEDQEGLVTVVVPEDGGNDADDGTNNAADQVHDAEGVQGAESVTGVHAAGVVEACIVGTGVVVQDDTNGEGASGEEEAEVVDSPGADGAKDTSKADETGAHHEGRASSLNFRVFGYTHGGTSKSLHDLHSSSFKFVFREAFKVLFQ